MSNVQSRAWVFTLNNPALDLDVTAGQLPAHPSERYAVWQLEKGANGTEHYQGYVELHTNVKIGNMKKWLPRAHFEKRAGTREQARDYCKKQDETFVAGPWERGDFERGGSGKRNDLADAVAALKAGGIKRVVEEVPTAFVKFSRGLRELARELEEKPRDEGFVPRPWQQRVLKMLQQPPNDRTIVWVFDQEGNRGKSRLVRHLMAEHGATLLEGRVADMAMAYEKERIVCLDLTRAQAEVSDHLYSFAEKLKNGILFSTKYESRVKHFSPPHVVFFANFAPPTSVWTADRLKLVDLSEQRWHDPHFLPDLGNAEQPGDVPPASSERLAVAVPGDAEAPEAVASPPPLDPFACGFA